MQSGLDEAPSLICALSRKVRDVAPHASSMPVSDSMHKSNPIHEDRLEDALFRAFKIAESDAPRSYREDAAANPVQGSG